MKLDLTHGRQGLAQELHPERLSVCFFFNFSNLNNSFNIGLCTMPRRKRRLEESIIHSRLWYRPGRKHNIQDYGIGFFKR